MAKRKLSAAAEAAVKKSPLDLAEEQEATPPPVPATSESPLPPRERARVRVGGVPDTTTAPQQTSTRATDRLSISLLPEERVTLEERARGLQSAGHRDIKTSRLARVAFKLLEQTPDHEVLRLADQVPNLEQLRVKGR